MTNPAKTSNVSNRETGSKTETVQQAGTQSDGVLKLRNQKPRVQWTEETIDNEHMNKKKTKICCIYHPADGYDSCSSSDSESDASDEENGSSSPNAYEKQPKYD